MLLSLSSIFALPLAAQSTSLDQLPSATQEEIGRVCLPVQYREGAGAYRNCVQTEISLRNDNALSGKNGPTDLARLSFDDKYAVQQACAKAGGQSSSDYQSCVTTQINELSAVEQPKLDLISEDELYVVQQSCFEAQSKQGAASYRRCLNGEVNSLLAIPAADTSDLNMLKKNALQLRCSSNTSSAVQYRQCVASEFESIAGQAPSFLPVSTATAVTANVPQSNNRQQNSSAVNNAVEKVAEKKQVPTEPVVAANSTADPSASTTTSDNTQVVTNELPKQEPTMALPRNISPPGTQQSQLDQAASTATDVTVNTESQSNSTENILVAQNTSANTATDVLASDIEVSENAGSDNAGSEIAGLENNDATNARVISRPELVETLNKQAQSKAQGIELEAANGVDKSTLTGGTDLLSKASGLWQKFLSSLSSLDSTGWLIIAGILALPALLLGLFSFTRRLKKPTVIAATSNPDLASRIEPGLQTRKLRHEHQAASLFDDETPSAQADNDHDAITRIATKSERPVVNNKVSDAPAMVETQSASENKESENKAAPNNNQPSGKLSGWQSAFGGWLERLPEADRTSACIEFLVYWVAYGDDRFEPELKKRLFTATDLSTHDEIKRWVLKQDVFAFSDVIVWMRQYASQHQLDQSISLIWALLVTENNVTPVQNTLIRYLSDAFNIGKENIESRFEKAFGHSLPNMPRPDSLAWWAKQDDVQVQNWNARAIATRPDNEQMIARLGLPTTFNEAQVINAFRRSARRCHPDRFTALGDRERALAEQRFIKFEEARDKLLGVSV